MKTLESFTSGGGILKGGKTSSHETYEGAPRPYNRELMTEPTEADLQPGKTGLGHGAHHTGGTGSTGMRPDSGYSGSNLDGTGSSIGNKAERIDGSMDGNRGQFENTTDHKPSMIDRLNPLKKTSV